MCVFAKAVLVVPLIVDAVWIYAIAVVAGNT